MPWCLGAFPPVDSVAMTDAIFFDDGKGLLSPLTDLRASFDVRTGALTTLERLCRAFDLQPVGLVVPKALEAVTRERHAARGGETGGKAPAVNSLPRSDEPRLFLNGRCVLPLEVITTLEPGQALVESRTGHLIAAVIEPAEFKKIMAGETATAAAIGLDGAVLLGRPWDVIRDRDAALDADLEMLGERPTQELPPGVLGIGESPLTIDATAVVYPGVTLDMEAGAIVVDAGATLRPGATVVGPAYIGPHASVLERGLVRPHSAIGPWCKVSGEVGGVIFQGYANKAHDGHLGDSWIGEWVNLGAGTTNSNLLNTYGEVLAKPGPGLSNERTGRQFLGAIIGDHVKTAIGTRIMTGAVLGTGGMFARTAPVQGATPRFVWSTDAGDKTFRFDKFAETAAAMMARRKIVPSEAYLELLGSLASG